MSDYGVCRRMPLFQEILHEQSCFEVCVCKYRVLKWFFWHFPLVHVPGTWELVKVTGDCPPPCHSFTLTMISQTKAVLFGGLEAQTNKCMKDVYVAELTKETVVSKRACGHVRCTSTSVPCHTWRSTFISVFVCLHNKYSIPCIT